MTDLRILYIVFSKMSSLKFEEDKNEPNRNKEETPNCGV